MPGQSSGNFNRPVARLAIGTEMGFSAWLSSLFVHDRAPGATAKRWRRACRQRCAAAAAVNAMASGSQHRTIRAISHRIAFSLSVSAPSSSATYRMGAASVSMRDLRKLHRRGAGFVAFLAGRSFPRRFVNGCNAHHGARVAIEGDDDIGKHFTAPPVRDEILPIIKNTARQAAGGGLAVSLWPAG